jgi:N-methylhydantoinase A
VAFGGAGPLHATLVAEELAMTRVILPDSAGVFSALGASLADFRYDFVHSLPRRFEQLGEEQLVDLLAALERQASGYLADLPVGERRIERSLDLRYVGQSFEINTPLTPGDERLARRDSVLARFHQLHESAYGYADPAEPVELVNVRLTAFGLTPKPTVADEIGSRAEPVPLRAFRGPAFDEANGELEYPVFDRADLAPGSRVVGPCILVDPSSTALVLRGWSGEVDRLGNILLESRS